MKFAINTLAGNRAILKQHIKTQTNNAESYYQSGVEYRKQASRQLIEAARNDVAYRAACVARNQYQTQLNELDAAIAKLES